MTSSRTRRMTRRSLIPRSPLCDSKISSVCLQDLCAYKISSVCLHRGGLGIKHRLVIFMAVSTDINPHPKKSCPAFQRTAGSRFADRGSEHRTSKTTRVSLRLILHRALRQIKEILEAKFPRVIFTKAPYAPISHTPNTAIAAFERTAVTKWNTAPRFAHQTGHECHCL